MLRHLLDKPPIPTPHEIEQTGDDTPARSIWRFVWRMSGRHQVWICLLGAIVAALSMAPLELQRLIVNDVIEAGEVDTLILLGALYLGVLLLLSGLKLAFKTYQSWLSESAVRYLRDHLSTLHRRHALDGTEQEGRAVPVINKESEELGGFVGEGLSGPFVQVGTFGAILGYMLVTEPLLAAIAAVFLIPQMVVIPLLQRIINRLLATRIELLRDLGDMIARITPNGDDIPEERTVCDHIGTVYRNQMRILVLKFVAKTVVNILNGLAPLTALVLGGYFVIQGQTSLGVVVAFVSGFDRLSEPLRQVIIYYRLYARARVLHHKIAQWM